MGKTLTEKIISEKVGSAVYAGDYVLIDVDKIYVHEGSGPRALEQIERTGIDKIAKPDKTYIFLDHAAPSYAKELSNSQKQLRNFAKCTGAHLSDIGGGLCHTIILFDHIDPGDIVIGGDSHTCTSGALGAFATGMGSTDVGIAMALGKTWLKVPGALKFELSGRFPKGVYAKDLILHIIGMIGSDGATYKSMEFGGEAIERMKIHDRLTVCNMVVEAGAKVGLFPSDHTTKAFLKTRGREDRWREIKPDEDAQYEMEYAIDVGQLEPTISCPHFVDSVRPVSDESLRHVEIGQGFLGSCTNGYIEDLRIAAQILQKNGGKIHRNVRLIVNAASREVFEKAMEEGLLSVFSKAGDSINTPGCGVCIGSHQGVLADEEVAIGSNSKF